MKKDKKDLLKMLMQDEESESMMDDTGRSAKMDVLKELIGMASGSAGRSIADDLGEMQKVTVAAPDKEGLEEGLKKAEEILGMQPEMEEMDQMDEESDDEENAFEPEMPEMMMAEKEEEDDEDDDELDGLSILERKARMMAKLK